MGETRTGRELIDALTRWADSGGVWRVQARGSATVTVVLLRCDAGEVVDRISSEDPEWREYLHDRHSSEG